MVSQKIRDISPKGLRAAKGVIATLELLGLDEDDLLKLKEIDGMREEIASLRAESERLAKALAAASDPLRDRSVAEQLSEMFAGKTEEFRPDGR